MNASDDLLFADEAPAADPTATVSPEPAGRSWKVLVVDDEQEVHAITELALGDTRFEGKGLEFLHAHSGSEANTLIEAHPDTALILLDVVMESEDAGLNVVKHIRQRLRNNIVRIILRTGQPGQAPERKVILEYDINDYKTKTELTSQKLFTTVVAALRAYRDLKIIDSNKRGLEKIIQASSSMFELKSLEQFIVGALTQITALLYLDEHAAFVTSFAACEQDGELVIVAGTGQYADQSHCSVAQAVPADVQRCLRDALERGATQYYEDRCVIYFRTKNGTKNMMFMQGTRNLSDWDRNLLEIFCGNIAVALDNIYLVERIVQHEIEAERQRLETAQARDALSRYLSPQIADDVLRQGITFTGTRTAATTMFFDLRNFTAVSESLPAEQVVGFLNHLFTQLVDIIFEHNGMLDKFLGDGLMAVFGVPLSNGSHALDAIRAALRMREAVAEVNRIRPVESIPPLAFGLGIHSGDVVAGNVGSRKRADYTVIGKAVNMASRIETLTKHFNTDILISEATWEHTKDAVICRRLEAVAVKGFQQQVVTYALDRLR